LSKLEANKDLFNSIFPNKKIELSKYSFYKPNDDIKAIYDKISLEVNNALKLAKKTNANTYTKELFSYDKLKFVFSSEKDEFYKINHLDSYKLYVLPDNKIMFSHGSKQLVKNEEIMINYPINAMSKLDNLIKKYIENINQNNIKIKALSHNTFSNFTKQDQQRINQIDKEIISLEKVMIEEEQGKIDQEQYINDDNTKRKGKNPKI